MATVNLSPLFNAQTMFGPTGLPLAGGQIYCYQAGSSTPLATYTTVNGTVPNTNPIILGSDGKLPQELWLQSGYAYKFVVEDVNSVLIDTYDNISGIITSIPTTTPSIPSGCILIWSGSQGSIPSGFVLCNGSNGTPDLRNSFVLGAGNTYTVGQTGGSTTTTLTQANLPNVNFTVTDPGHLHDVSSSGSGTLSNSSASGSTSTTTATTGTSTTGITVSSGGSGTAVSILNPYYALCYIQKT
jgi:hypothetical protein